MRTSAPHQSLRRLFNVRREEVLPVALAALFFFCVLTALMVLRPARDALGMQRGIDAVRWLFVGTALVTLAALILFEAAFRAIQRALTRPARETLYTVVSREDKYKSKAFIDTFGYRGGDVLGAQLEGALARLGMGLAGLLSFAIPLAVAWAALGWWLGRAAAKRQSSVTEIRNDHTT